MAYSSRSARRSSDVARAGEVPHLVSFGGVQYGNGLYNANPLFRAVSLALYSDGFIIGPRYPWLSKAIPLWMARYDEIVAIWAAGRRGIDVSVPDDRALFWSAARSNLEAGFLAHGVVMEQA